MRETTIILLCVSFEQTNPLTGVAYPYNVLVAATASTSSLVDDLEMLAPSSVTASPPLSTSTPPCSTTNPLLWSSSQRIARKPFSLVSESHEPLGTDRKVRSQLNPGSYVQYCRQVLDWSRPYLAQTRPAILIVPSTAQAWQSIGCCSPGCDDELGDLDVPVSSNLENHRVSSSALYEVEIGSSLYRSALLRRQGGTPSLCGSLFTILLRRP